LEKKLFTVDPSRPTHHSSLTFRITRSNSLILAFIFSSNHSIITYPLMGTFMKSFLVSMAFCLAAFAGTTQTSVVKQIQQVSPPAVALEPLRFLASDELMGRATTRPEIQVAARYIGEQFRSCGVKEVPGTTDYIQQFDIKMAVPASSGALVVNGRTYEYGKELLQVSGEDVSLEAFVVFAGYGTKTDLDKVDVKGKIVVTDMGLNDSSSFREGIRSMESKQQMVREKGAVALVERFKKAGVPWQSLQHRYLEERMMQAKAAGLPVFILNDEAASVLPLVQSQPTATLKASGNQIRTILARNVMGMIEGTDPKLKDQYLLLSAHYDHLGVAPQPKMVEGKLDSIYNGARDNAIGVAAVINAARYFAKYPPKRSVLFMAYTGEEIGMIGSRYFSEHPTVPLEKIVYNLNIDNAGYNDTTMVTVVGLGRTSADEDIKKACAAFGLTAMPDPAPEQNLFDRSDNVNLAHKGVPAPTFSLGFKAFDETITKYYHQVSDEVGSFNLSYALKYMNSFVLAARNIADNAAQPEWKKGDKYEAAWKELYRKAL
jgi:hypothetical protein